MGFCCVMNKWYKTRQFISRLYAGMCMRSGPNALLSRWIITHWKTGVLATLFKQSLVIFWHIGSLPTVDTKVEKSIVTALNAGNNIAFSYVLIACLKGRSTSA